MCSMLSLGPLWASEMGPLEKLFDSISCYLLSQQVTCYVLSGFRNSPLISIHIIIQLSLLLYFSKYIRLRQYYEFPFILRDLRHIYQRVLRQLQANSKTRTVIERCKLIECVVGRTFLMSKRKKMSFLFTSFPWLSNELLWSINKLKQGLWYPI